MEGKTPESLPPAELPALDAAQWGSLSYLALLGAVLAAVLVVRNRDNLGRLAQTAAIWVFIFLGAIVTAGLWSDIRQTVVPRQAVVVETGQVQVPRSHDGHYYLTLDINGVATRFVVDTGATDIVLTQEAAARAGIPVDGPFTGRAMTANGMVQTARVQLDTVTLGEVTDHRVSAVVNSGTMLESLLGMSYLQRFDRIEISDNRLLLTR